MIVAEIKVGRLLEIRVTGRCPREDFLALRSGIAKAMVSKPGQLVMVTDFRDAERFPEEVADMALGLMKTDNARLERNIHFHTHGSPFAEQMKSMVETVGHPSRRVFFSIAPALAWADEVLTQEEKARLRTFLADRPRNAAPP